MQISPLYRSKKSLPTRSPVGCGWQPVMLEDGILVVKWYMGQMLKQSHNLQLLLRSLLGQEGRLERRDQSADYVKHLHLYDNVPTIFSNWFYGKQVPKPFYLSCASGGWRSILLGEIKLWPLFNLEGQCFGNWKPEYTGWCIPVSVKLNEYPSW